MIEKISHGDELIAIIIKKDYKKNGIEFFTPGEFSQQLGYMNRPEGYKIKAHIHNPVERSVVNTQEVLFIRSGKVKANFYTRDLDYFCSVILNEGDIILLASGGHGFEFLEASEVIEVKQGPYSGDMDKKIFEA